jgi:hypothetical protein
VMDVIVCTAGVGYVLRTSVCTSPTALEAEVLGSGLEFVTEAHLAVLWRCFRIGLTTARLARSPDSRSLLRTV